MKFILYFVFTTIYGLIGLAFVIYYSTNFIKEKFFNKLSDDIAGYITFFIMAPIVVYGLSYERILFDKHVRKVISLPYTKEVSRAYCGDVIEPMSWFNSYICGAQIIMPPMPEKNNLYFKLIFSLGEGEHSNSWYGESKVVGEEPWCDEKEISLYTNLGRNQKPKKLGYDQNRKMTEKEFNLYCGAFDWKPLQREFLKTL